VVEGVEIYNFEYNVAAEHRHLEDHLPARIIAFIGDWFYTFEDAHQYDVRIRLWDDTFLGKNVCSKEEMYSHNFTCRPSYERPYYFYAPAGLRIPMSASGLVKLYRFYALMANTIHTVGSRKGGFNGQPPYFKDAIQKIRASNWGRIVNIGAGYRGAGEEIAEELGHCAATAWPGPYVVPAGLAEKRARPVDAIMVAEMGNCRLDQPISKTMQCVSINILPDLENNARGAPMDPRARPAALQDIPLPRMMQGAAADVIWRAVTMTGGARIAPGDEGLRQFRNEHESTLNNLKQHFIDRQLDSGIYTEPQAAELFWVQYRAVTDKLTRPEPTFSTEEKDVLFRRAMQSTSDRPQPPQLPTFGPVYSGADADLPAQRAAEFTVVEREDSIRKAREMIEKGRNVALKSVIQQPMEVDVSSGEPSTSETNTTMVPTSKRVVPETEREMSEAKRQHCD